MLKDWLKFQKTILGLILLAVVMVPSLALAQSVSSYSPNQLAALSISLQSLNDLLAKFIAIFYSPEQARAAQTVRHNYTIQSCYGGTNANNTCNSDADCTGGGTCLAPVVAWWNLDEPSETRAATGGSCGADCNLIAQSTVPPGQNTSNRMEGVASINFGPDNNWARCADAACDELDVLHNATVACWAYSTDDTATNQMVNNFGGNGGYRINRLNSNDSAQVTTGDGASTITGNSSANTWLANTWAHVAFTFEDLINTAKIFINGEQKNTFLPQDLAGGTSDFYLSYNYAPQDWDGQLDECFVANQAYTNQQVCEICRFGLDGEESDRGAQCGSCDPGAAVSPPSSDTTPPVLSNAAPSGTLPASTTQTSLSLTTDENATCKYSTTANTSYSSMSSTFSTTGSTNHSSLITGLTNGQSYNYYVRCQDTSNNPNTSDYSISFSVASPPSSDTTPPTVSITTPTNNSTVSGNTTITATASDNVGVIGVTFFYDLVNQIADVLTSPFTTLWNTSAVIDGIHNLIARARDVAGNLTTSSPVSVTVSNTLPSGSTYYVDPITGDNTNNGTSPSTPWQNPPGTRNISNTAFYSSSWGSIATANKIKCGDTIYLKSGSTQTSVQGGAWWIGTTYYSDTCTSANPITIRIARASEWVASSGNFILDGTGVTATGYSSFGDGGGSGGVAIEVSGVLFGGVDATSRMEIKNFATPTNGVVQGEGLIIFNNLTIREIAAEWLDVHHNRSVGIGMGRVEQSRVANALIHHNGAAGLNCGLAADNNCRDVGWVDIDVYNNVSAPAICASLGDAIETQGSDSVWMLRVKVHDNGCTGINVGSARHVIANDKVTHGRDLEVYNNATIKQCNPYSKWCTNRSPRSGACTSDTDCGGVIGACVQLPTAGNVCSVDADCGTIYGEVIPGVCRHASVATGIQGGGDTNNTPPYGPPNVSAYYVGLRVYGNQVGGIDGHHGTGWQETWNATLYRNGWAVTYGREFNWNRVGEGMYVRNSIIQKGSEVNWSWGNSGKPPTPLDMPPTSDYNIYRPANTLTETFSNFNFGANCQGFNTNTTTHSSPACFAGSNDRIGFTNTDAKFVNIGGACASAPYDYSSCDFHLLSGSDAINAGTYLMRASSAGADSMTVSVLGNGMSNDPRSYFIERTSYLDAIPDTIQIKGATCANAVAELGSAERAKIVSMTATSITLDRSCSWPDNAGVHLPWEGAAPDIGAYEYAGSAPPPPTSFDFSLSNSGNISVSQAGSAVNTITATLVNGTPASLTFSASGLPTGATASFSPVSCSPNCSTTLTITTPASTPLGNSTITVTAIGGGTTKTTSFTLTISDTTFPAITFSSVSSVTQTSATISFTTDELATNQIEYGFTPSYGTSTPRTTSFATNHSITLNNLSASTTFNYRIHAFDSAGNETIGINRSFTTLPSVIPDTTPPSAITNLSASQISQTSADISWTSTGDNGIEGTSASYDLRYSTSAITDANFNSTTQATGLPTPKLAGSSEVYVLAGLSPSTTYFVAIQSTDSAGNTSLLSNIATFTTLAVTQPPPPPVPPPVGGSGGGGGGGGGSGGGGGGYFDDITPPQTPKNATTTSLNNQITLRWKNPPDTDFVRVAIVKNTSSSPQSRTDGVLIYEGSKEEFHDIDLDNTKTYHYAIYAYDKKPNYSSPAMLSAQPQAGVETTSITVPVPPPLQQTQGKQPCIPQTIPGLTLTRSLALGSTGADIKLLQQYLNTNGFIIAQSGPGSPGNESTYFGSLTVKAVQRFQAQNGIVTSGSPETTGYGAVGPKTRGVFAKSTMKTSCDVSVLPKPKVTTAISLFGPFSVGITSPQVTLLQQLLAKDTNIYPEGLMTGFYGPLTVKAVQRFQTKYNILTSGSPDTTGYGLAGPRTRERITEILGR